MSGALGARMWLRGETYSNDCWATYYGGVTSWVDGGCTGTATDCVDLGGVDFGFCDMAMGVVMYNGSCTYLSGCGWVVDRVDYSVYSFASMEDCQASCPETSECLDPSLADPRLQHRGPCSGMRLRQPEPFQRLRGDLCGFCECV